MADDEPRGLPPLRAYRVAEIRQNGLAVDAIEGLAAAKVTAKSRARWSEYPVVVRDLTTGIEVARFEPGKKTSSVMPLPPARSSMSDALTRLREANQRLRKVVEAPLPKPKKAVRGR